MPSKLKKAIGAVKDQTSIGLAHIAPRSSSSSSLEVAVLKATSHDHLPADDRRISAVVLLAASSPAAAAAVASALRRRLSRTRTWSVALKTLSAAAAALSDSGPDLRPELSAHRVLDLSLFSDPSSWDFTAFVRTYALYLDSRLHSSLAGHVPPNHRRRDTIPADAKPSLVLDRLARWQRILDRAMGTRPTGPARSHPLVRAAMSQVVRETHDLYRNVSAGLSLLLAKFFHLPYPSCVATLEVCSKAAKQFEDLDGFYVFCRNVVGVGRAEEYPDVQRITKLLLQTLEQYIKDYKEQEEEGPQVKIGGISTCTLDDNNKYPKKESPSLTPTMSLVRANGDTSACTLDHHEKRSNKYSKIKESPGSLIDISSPRSARSTFLDHHDWSDKSSSVASPSSSTSTMTMMYRTRKEAAEEEEAEMAKKKMERDPFARSLAWGAQRMDGPARQKLIEEQQMWLQHQNKMKRSLGW